MARVSTDPADGRSPFEEGVYLTSDQAIAAWARHCQARGLPPPTAQQRDLWNHKGLPIATQLALGLTRVVAYRRVYIPEPGDPALRSHLDALRKLVPELVDAAGLDVNAISVELSAPADDGTITSRRVPLGYLLAQTASLVEDPVPEETSHAG